MNKTDFIVSCAKLAGWNFSNGTIMAPNMFLFHVSEIVTGFSTGIKQDDWDLLYYESLLDKCIAMINSYFADGSGNFEIVTHFNGVVIFDRDKSPRGIFSGESKEVKENLLHRYFELLAANNG